MTSKHSDAGVLPASTLLLPGRTVDVEFLESGDGGRPYFDRGIVIDVTTDGVCTVRFADGLIVTESGHALRPITPDRPTLAHDEFVVGALGEKLAERQGRLEGFHKGHNEGRIVFTDVARSLLAEIDTRAFALKHTRCAFRFVETPAGEKRENRTAYEPGDRLVECAFFVDGPGLPYCGVHRPIVEAGTLPCIYHAGATAAEQDEARGRGELVHRSPIVVPRQVQPERVLTEVEQHAVALDRLVDVVRAALHTAPTTADVPGMDGGALYLAVEAYLAERDRPAPGSMYWEALAHGVRTGRLVFHAGPRYSAAPDYMAHAAAVAK